MRDAETPQTRAIKPAILLCLSKVTQPEKCAIRVGYEMFCKCCGKTMHAVTLQLMQSGKWQPAPWQARIQPATKRGNLPAVRQTAHLNPANGLA